MLSHQSLGLCSWSLHPKNPDDVLAGLAELGLKKVHIALDPMRCDIETWRFTGPRFWEAGVAMVCGMFGSIGEDYATPQRIRETGGVVPDEHWQQNRENIRNNIKLANTLDTPMISTHAGFIPEDEKDPQFIKMLDRIDDIAKMIEEITDEGWLLLETGQENADTLINFHEQLMQHNVGVNFDPANMILYDMGDPIEALERAMPYVKQVHIKDALPPKQKGEWGTEVPIGQGAVDWPAFIKVLKDNAYDGDLIIEREAGDDRMKDIKTAVEFISNLL